jgi:outer membrane protein assembly factor BamB
MALGAADGAQQWVQAGEALAGTNMEVHALLVAGGNVIVAPMSGPLVALREGNGATVWSGPALPAGADPTTAQDNATSDGTLVYVISHTYADGPSGEITNFPVRLMALEASDGSVQWNRTLPSNVNSGTLTMSDGVLLNRNSITSATGYSGYNENGSLLWAFDKVNGTQLWQDNSPPTGIS